MRPEGSTLKTGLSTERNASDQMAVLRILMKIEAFGTSEASRTLFARRTTTFWTIKAIATAKAMTAPFWMSASVMLMTCWSMFALLLPEVSLP